MGRLATTLAIGSLVALQVFSGSAGAADTRHLFVGSDSSAKPENNGLLTLSAVTVNGVSIAPVHVENVDNQTLNHVVLTFMAPTGGLDLTGRFGTDAGACSPAGTVPMVCDFGSMKAGAKKDFTVVYTATSTAAATVTAQVTFNETKPNTGSNTHIDSISGGVTPADGGCNLVVTYLPPGHSGSIGTPCDIGAANPQSTSVVVPSSVVSGITVGEEASTLCSGGLDCFGQASVADVAQDGTYTVVWTIQWQVDSTFNLNKFGVLHYADGATTPNLNITWKRDQCKNANATGCFVSASVSGTTLTAVIRTAGNGSMRGFR
jgi:hypothetical protein